ncbi:MAG: hypothetical protein AB2536_00950 [Candidatus Thiodiazotropha endolucinida]
MNTTKIHINLKQGILEAEGSEEFVEKIYTDFKENIRFEMDSTSEDAKQPPADAKAKSAPKKVAVKKSKTTKTKTKSGGSDPTLVKDLDLTGGGSKESLRDYCAKYLIKTNMERNLVFSYYLENIIGVKDFGVNHIFTCYRNIPGTKIPGNLKQSIYDTSAKGWIAVKSIDDDISVPVMGINHIEHDLPKASESES